MSEIPVDTVAMDPEDVDEEITITVQGPLLDVAMIFAFGNHWAVGLAEQTGCDHRGLELMQTVMGPLEDAVPGEELQSVLKMHPERFDRKSPTKTVSVDVDVGDLGVDDA